MFNPALFVPAIIAMNNANKKEDMEENKHIPMAEGEELHGIDYPEDEMPVIPMPNPEAQDEYREKPEEVTPLAPTAAEVKKKKEEEDIDEELDDEDLKELVEDNRSIGERLDDLANEHFATGLEVIRKLQKGKRVSKKTLEAHGEMAKHIRGLQTMYAAMIKLGRIQPDKEKKKGEGEFNKGVIDQIKKKHSSIGNVSLQIPQEPKN